MFPVDHEILEKQTAFLKAVISFEKPINKLIEMDVTGPCWEEQPEGFYFVVLTRANVIAILKRFIMGDITANDVYEWANFFDMRFDVDKEPGYANLIVDILANISLSHEIGSPLTDEEARKIIHKLQSQDYDRTDV